MFNENPQTAPRSALGILDHATRCRVLAVYARRNGDQLFGVFQAYIDSTLPDSDSISTDGAHMMNLG